MFVLPTMHSEPTARNGEENPIGVGPNPEHGGLLLYVIFSERGRSTPHGSADCIGAGVRASALRWISGHRSSQQCGFAPSYCALHDVSRDSVRTLGKGQTRSGSHGAYYFSQRINHRDYHWCFGDFGSIWIAAPLYNPFGRNMSRNLTDRYVSGKYPSGERTPNDSGSARTWVGGSRCDTSDLSCGSDFGRFLSLGASKNRLPFNTRQSLKRFRAPTGDFQPTYRTHQLPWNELSSDTYKNS